MEVDQNEPIDKLLPQNILEAAELIVDLQNKLMNFSPYSLPELVAYCSEHFIDNKSIHCLIHHILEAVRYRSQQIDLIALFLKAYFSEISKTTPMILDYLEDDLLKQICQSLLNPFPFPKEAAIPSFLYACYSKKILPLYKILNIIEKFKTSYPTFIESLAWLGAYFIDEIPEDTLSIIHQRVSNNEDIDEIFINFYNDPNLVQKESEIIQILKDDDPDMLLKYLTPAFNYNLTILPRIFEENFLLLYNPSIISCAAYFGAVKCFKLLLLNQASLSRIDDDHHTIAHFAVAGGNTEIVRLLQQQQVSFNDTLHYATEFYREDLFDWLNANFYPDLTVKSSHNFSIFHVAAYSGNIAVLLNCIQNKLNVNAPTFSLYQQTPVLKAAENGKFDVVKILLSIPDIDLNIDAARETPLIFAARNGRSEVVQLLLNDQRVDVNYRGPYGTALHYACKYMQTEIVNILLESKRVDPMIKNSRLDNPYQMALNSDSKEIQVILKKNRTWFQICKDSFKEKPALAIIVLLIFLFIGFWFRFDSEMLHALV